MGEVGGLVAQRERVEGRVMLRPRLWLAVELQLDELEPLAAWRRLYGSNGRARTLDAPHRRGEDAPPYHRDVNIPLLHLKRLWHLDDKLPVCGPRGEHPCFPQRALPPQCEFADDAMPHALHDRPVAVRPLGEVVAVGVVERQPYHMPPRLCQLLRNRIDVFNGERIA